MYFKGTGGPDKKLFEANLKLFGEIKEDTVKYAARPRCIEFALEKVSLNSLCMFLVSRNSFEMGRRVQKNSLNPFELFG